MKFVLRIGTLLLCVIALSMLLPACGKKNDLFAMTGLSSLTIEKNDAVKAIVGLSITDAEAHKGEKAYIYELFPGEDLTAIQGKKALDDASVSTEMTFEFPLHDGTHTRLYSSFAVCYENGSLLLERAYVIENPQKLSSSDALFGGKETPKGLHLSDVESAVSMDTSHAMLEVFLSSLFAGEGESYSFDGTEYTVSASVMKTLDRRVKDSFGAGMQISLRVVFDSSVSRARAVSALDFLAARYANENFGIVTAMFVLADTAKDAAELSFYARTALISHMKNGRIYIGCKEQTVSAAADFFLHVGKRIAELGNFTWGAAVIPTVTQGLPWEHTGTDVLDVESLASFYETLRSYKHRPVYLAVSDLLFDASDENVQAVSLAYAYAKAIEAGAGLVYYGAQKGDSGLLSAGGTERVAADMFRRIDLGLDREQIYLCKSVSGKAWKAIEALKPSRTALGGNGSTGFGVADQKYLYDFTGGETFGFVSVGGMTEPESRESAAWERPVLYTWLNAANGKTGVRKLMQNGNALADASALTFQFLAQYHRAERCNLILQLRGTDAGGMVVSYESVAPFDGKRWQTVTFDISEFTAKADLSQPCVLTVLYEPGSDTDETFALFLKGIYVIFPQGGTNMVLPIVLTVAGAALGFLLIFILYRRVYVSRRKRG